MTGHSHQRAELQPRDRVNAPASVLLFLLIGLAATSCSRETRHEILTFFFTGVPPLEGEADATDTDAAGLAARSAETAGQRRSETLRRRQVELARALNWTHGPYAAGQCDLCHSFAGSLGFRTAAAAASDAASASSAGASRLAMPLEELCLSCHTTKTIETADAL